MGFYMIMPILPVYAVQDIGLEQGEVGLIIGIFAISAVVARPACGYLVDRYGRMIVYLPAMVLFTLCFGSYIFAATVATLLLVRLIHGLSWGMVNTATATIVADIIPQKFRSRGIGYFGLSMTAAMAIGPSLAAFMLSHFSLKIIFISSVVLCFIGLLFSLNLKPPVVNKDKKSFNILMLFEKRVFGISVVEFFFGFIYASVMAYVALHALEIKVTVLGTFFLVYALSMAITRPLGGKIMEKYGPTFLIVSGIILFAAGLISTGLARFNGIFLLAGIFLGIGAGFIMPTIMTMAVNVVPPYRRGAANATILVSLDVGIGLGAVIFGKIAEAFGYEKMYLISALILLCPLLIYLFFVSKKYTLLKNEMENNS